MGQFKVHFLPQDVTVTVDEGTSLLDAQIKAQLHPDAPCGGKGTCGKCLVNILSGGPAGIQKACVTEVHEDMEVELKAESLKHSILLEGAKRNIVIDPAIKGYHVAVEKCLIGDSRSDWARLKEAVSQASGIPAEEIPVSLPVISGLYDYLLAHNFEADVIMCENEIIDLADGEKPLYVMAYDIGTTTIVGYLLNARTGRELAVSSMLNPQSQFGADVIQRSNHALAEGVEELSSCVRKALNDLAAQAAFQAGITAEEIYMITVVGNTCMHHLFAGIMPGALVHSPYNPSVSESMMLPAAQYGIRIHPHGKIMLLPNIAGFVGADTVGVLLATQFDTLEDLTLVIDIGTNGEMVLGNKDHMIACSTAAGPAFEGAKIQCGMRGAEGAIDHVHFENNQLVYSTIGNAKPVGICGSGLMDIIAELLKAGIIASSGRLEKPEALTGEIGKANAHRIEKIDNFLSFVLADERESGTGKKIFLSQKDIREVQLAKSAMAAGILLMSDTLKIRQEDIKKIMIAGAFGNYMSPDSACAIGLLPQELRDRIEPIGNAAGEGSKIAALNKEEFHHCDQMARQTEFLELATHPDFQDCYVDELEFPEYE